MEIETAPAMPRPGPLRGTWRAFRAHPAAFLAALVLAGLVAIVVVGPWLSPWQADRVDFDGTWSEPPSLVDGHWFGTDDLGRDLFVRTLEGGRVSLLVGLAASLVSLLIGVSYGAYAGFRGGRTDAVLMRFVDILYALPFLFLVILLMVLFGRHLVLLFVAIGAIHWLDMARIVRGQTIALKRREFVVAARAAGVEEGRILRRHVVPNLLGIVVVYLTLTIPQAILVETFLSFLGLGVQAPTTSWGVLVNDGARVMESTPWALLFPAGFLATTLLCLNVLGDALRDAFDRRL